MPEVVLFHHVQGLTPGVVAFADELRAAGHTVHTPDLFEGRTFPTLEEGLGHAEEIGFGEGMDRGARAVEGLPTELVYAGFSLGGAARAEAGPDPTRRTGGAVLLLLRADLGVRAVAHGRPRADARDGRRSHLRRRGRHRRGPGTGGRGRGCGAVPVPGRPASLRRQLAAFLRSGRHGAPHPAGARFPRGAVDRGAGDHRALDRAHAAP